MFGTPRGKGVCRAGLMALAAWGLMGCIGAPGFPGGPLQGTGASVAASYGYALAPSRVTLRSTVDGRQDSYVDNAGDAVNLPIVPSRLGGRIGISKWFDAAGDLSYLDSGFELRAGLPEGTRPFPMALSLGVRRGKWGMLDFENRASTEQRLRFEAYPRLAQSNSKRFNLITTLGLSTGRRFHPSLLPGRFQKPVFDGPPAPTIDPRMLRDETRLEGSAGAELRQDHFFASLVFMPYVVTGSSHLTSNCRECDGWETQSFRSSFGAALFFSFGVSILLEELE